MFPGIFLPRLEVALTAAFRLRAGLLPFSEALTFIHVLTVSSLFLYYRVVVHYWALQQFVYPFPFDGYLGNFQFGDIMNEAAVNVHV